MSGTIGSVLYGVAKKVDLFAVKVLDAGGSGSLYVVDTLNHGPQLTAELQLRSDRRHELCHHRLADT